ncbi:MAG TPA: glycoside hydrolase family 38 C-terminal domain-containing protein [Candidatus Dormibacteraeota bacterium]|nr:glycoside hydrolase family 38 C-terminal domain-containing protein [Candidatus Dormibacteraeota bacterium]
MPDRQRTVYIVPHTHWDREWYEPFETFRAQLVTLWDELLALTESDPNFYFLMDGQSVVIDDYLEIRPQARQRLEDAVRRGQIQVGPWYTLPDEFLVSSETLVRDLQRGIADADAHGGSMRVGYLPDSFGHAAQMPQLYRQLGFAHAAVWRGVPLAIDRVAFLWQAPDGSEILTAYMGNSYAHGVDLPTEPDALSRRIASALEAIEPFHPTSDILLMNGNDHVLPQRALHAAVREASGRLDGTRIRLARLDDVLNLLPADGWPRWRGELRSSARANVLMGTLSVRVSDKQRYAEATRVVERLAEPAAALSGVDMQAPLEQAWTQILQNAAHDTACGSGIDAVAQTARRRSDAALRIAEEILRDCLPSLAGEGEVWNPSAFPRQDVIDIDGAPRLTPIIAGYSRGRLETATPSLPVSASPLRLENACLTVDLKSDGTVNVLDKETGTRFSSLNRLVDEADAGDEYNFSPAPEADEPFLTTLRGWSWTVLESGPIRSRAEIRFGQSIPKGLQPDRERRTTGRVPLPVRLVASLDADSRRLDIELELENQATDHRLRAHFPLPFPVRESAADTPFHVTRRVVTAPRRDPGAPELELPTYPMRSFVDLSDGHVGMTLITDGLHEYEVLPGDQPELALTLLRAVGWLSRDDLTTRTGHAGPGIATPGAQQLGQHRYRYSLFFHAGDWERASVWRAAETALVPLIPGHGSNPTTPPTGIELHPDCMQMTACVPRPDGYELRILNASDHPHHASVRLAPAPAEVVLVTLGGEPRAHPRLVDGAVTLSMRAWEIATLRVRR